MVAACAQVWGIYPEHVLEFVNLIVMITLLKVSMGPSLNFLDRAHALENTLP